MADKNDNIFYQNFSENQTSNKTPLECENIPEEVLNSITSPKSESTNDKPRIRAKDICRSISKAIQKILIIFLFIINYSPFLFIFIEVILRAVNHYEYRGNYVAQIIFYFIITIFLIYLFITKETNPKTTIGKCILCTGLSIIMVLIILIMVDLIYYFSSNDYFSSLNSFTKIIANIRIISIFVAGGYDIFIIIVNTLIYKGKLISLK